jgi:hypothetical protein
MKTPVKSPPVQVEPAATACVVVVVLEVVVVLDVVVVVVPGPIAWRLTAKITTRAANIPSDLRARLTD